MCQNSCSCFFFWGSIYYLWDGCVLIILPSIVVLTAVMSRFASIGTTIVAEKDGIVVLAEGSLNYLANKYAYICNFIIIIIIIIL
jgi:hypothetical protein